MHLNFDVGDPELTTAEVERMWWWFQMGSIMDPYVRRHLWKSWGFCPRHTWIHAVWECELRGGYLLATSILYEDLTRRAARALRSRLMTWNVMVQRLQPRDTCFTCDSITDTKNFLGEQRWLASAERANRFQRFLALLKVTQGQWEERSCPLCLGGNGLVCRKHLLLGTEPSADLSQQLFALANRLEDFIESMTWGSKPAGLLEQASWVEALGWFAGWDYLEKLQRTHKDTLSRNTFQT